MDRKVQMKSISEIEDQNDVLPTRTKEVTHKQKRSEKGGNDIVNKTYIRGKDAKKTRLKATHPTKTKLGAESTTKLA